MKRRVLAAVGLTACAAAGIALVPAAAAGLIRVAGWTRTLRKVRP